MTSQEIPPNASVSATPAGESTQQDHESEAPRLHEEGDPFNSRVETETDATHPQAIVTSPPPPVTASGPPPNMSGPEVATGSPPAPALETRTEQPRTNVHPQVAALKSMFPDFDDALLISVLESVHGNQDRAIDVLLGMSDPDFVSTAAPEPELSQTELDEQLARRLMIEEEQQQQANWQAQQPQQRDTYRQSRIGRNNQQQQQQQAEGQPADRDTMADIQDQFNKIAETGKKTFGTIFSKVKAKMQEFDQQRSGQGSSSGSTEPQWGAGGTSVQSQQRETYDPNHPDFDAPAPSIPTRRPVPVQGYDAAPSASAPAPGQASTARAGGTSPSPAGSNSRPTSPGGSNIDYGKLGLLPKRPVSLLRDQPPPAQAPPRPTNEDDELEYAENPFEDGHK